jgi:uncharacterized protein with von Willebrand factor type A (vWA) domain
VTGFAEERLVGFPHALRLAGIATDAMRSALFLRAVKSLELRELADLKRAARLTLVSSPVDFPVFEAAFDAWFSDEEMVAARPEPPGETPANRPTGDRHEFTHPLPGEAEGSLASPHDLHGRKAFRSGDDAMRDTLSAIQRTRLPAIVSRRWHPARSGPRIDIAATGGEARKTLGETLRLRQRARPRAARRILLLIDVSGSMKEMTETYLRAAHALVQGGAPVEVFCISARLHRITTALRRRHAESALRALSETVSGFDGGTRLGESLEIFLTTSRYAALVRGAVTVFLSDGLECGPPAKLIGAVERMSRLSYLLVWLSPLAGSASYRPATRAMADLLPFLDDLGDGSSLEALQRGFASLRSIERQMRGLAHFRWQAMEKTA